MLNRTSSTSTARMRFGISGTRMSKTFDGKCVTTIVRTSPIRVAKRDASSAEIPANTLAQKKMRPSFTGGTPNRRENQYSAKLCTTKPPPKEPRANKLDNFKTIERERPTPRKSLADTPLAGVADISASAEDDKRVNKNASATPRAA